MNTIARLFTAAGNVLKVAGAGWTCGHEPAHTSSSGTCVRIDTDKEQWYCFSCQHGGGPVEALMSLQGLSRTEAQAALTGQLGPGSSDDPDKRTIADRLIALATARATFFHDDYQNAFAIAPVDGHKETLAVHSRGFKRWLAHQFYREYEKSPNAEALAQATLILEAKALYEGPRHPLAWRLTWHGEAILYDLTDAAWNVVTLSPEGWSVANIPGVFRRGANAAPQVMPARGGTLAALERFLPPMSEADRLLLKVYLVTCFIPHIDHPIPVLAGDHGGAKSTLSEILRSLVDPAQAQLLSLPTDQNELALLLAHNYMPAFDNLDGLYPWQSDMLCRASTGGGVSKRVLYTDDDELVLRFWHCVVLNGITPGVTRPDLLDRTLPLHLQRLTEQQYRQKWEFWADFGGVRAGILGVLFDTVAAAMKLYPTVRLTALPRMSDFARWGFSAAEALGGHGEAFLKAYRRAISKQNDTALDNHPVATAIIALLGGRDTIAQQPENYLFWEGTAAELLTALEAEAETHRLDKKARSWPKAPHILMRRLQAVRVNLLDLGVSATSEHTGTHREVTLRKVSKNSVNTVCAVKDEEIQQDAGDASRNATLAEDPSSVEHPNGTASGAARSVTTSVSSNALLNKDDDATDGSNATFPYFSERGSIEVSDAPPDRLVEYLTTAAQLDAVLPALCAAPVLGVDTETTGLDPRRDRLRLIQFALDDRVVVVDAFTCPVQRLAPIFAARHLLAFHHAKFDLGFLHASGLPWPEAPLFDTQLAALLLGAGTADGKLPQSRLDLVAARYLGTSLDKTLQVSDWSGTLSPAQIAYAAEDAATTLHLVPVLKTALEAAGLAQVTAIECGCVPALTWLETCGLPIDTARWRDRAVRDEHQAEALEAQLCATLLANRGGSSLLLPEAVNWQSQAQVLALLQQRGHTLSSTDSSTLGAFAAVDPLIPLLLDYREAVKRAGTYGVRWLEDAVHPLTGRVHANYLQLGSAAGRMSCTKPNMQNLPRSTAYRGCITPDPGSCIVKADYSQIELRIAAVIARDTAMLDAYQAGEDVHATTAARLTGVPIDQVTPEARQLAKAVNFGLLYGMGAPRLQGYAQDTFRVTMTAAEAQHYRRLFFDAYRGLREWHRRTGQSTGWTSSEETRTLAGRRRLEVTTFTQRLNSPVQGTGADGMKWALARLFAHRQEAPDAHLLAVVHDELVASCPIEAAADTAAWLMRHMEQAMQEIVGAAVPTPVETTIGQDWAGTPLPRGEET